jgi:hypothetical protein
MFGFAKRVSPETDLLCSFEVSAWSVRSRVFAAHAHTSVEVSETMKLPRKMAVLKGSSAGGSTLFTKSSTFRNPTGEAELRR